MSLMPYFGAQVFCISFVVSMLPQAYCEHLIETSHSDLKVIWHLAPGNLKQKNRGVIVPTHIWTVLTYT